MNFNMWTVAGETANRTLFSVGIFLVVFLMVIYTGYMYRRRKLIFRLGKLRKEAGISSREYSLSLGKLSDELRELENTLVSDIKLEN